MNKNKAFLPPLFAAMLFLFGVRAQAVLTIEITRGVEAGMPIAVVPFGFEGRRAPQHDLARIVEADLMRSGRFEALPRRDFLSTPHDEKAVRFRDWRLIKAEALVVGRVRDLGAGRYQVQFQLFDVFKGRQLAGYRYVVSGRQLRRVAHKIADIVYEKLTGEPGAFDTRIAYVTVQQSAAGKRYLLQVADSDGYGAQTILDSPEPILSPAWSPDGRRLAYVSFEDRRPVVYVQDLARNKRTRVAYFEGLNSAPAWSPDGTRLALVLSKDGNAEIYVMWLASRRLKRLTHHHAIDTEPAWSPDGRHIVFTSDRSGKPQIYRMDADGGNLRRLTFEGSYNARATYSSDGKTLALVHRNGGGYKIAVLHLRNLALHVLTEAALDESPSFAPNGRMILYATEQQGRGVLSAVSADGRVRQLLKFQAGDVREPAWSPFNR